ncbi:MAG: HEPN domain-containing protein [Candidatus Margulisbacteria bacterium]|nr:HEPN domain-containing protein [Candidatus Margulisiibacteriota bacterium]MBU1617094.1 HEPN domain-containing protein [Candidatus Margulisiibacteriota bacterium]
MADQKEVKKWLLKAESDYLFSASILPDTTFFSQLCFFFQQSAEKYLKAFIVKHDLNFKKIHDLIELLETCKKHDPTFSNILEETRILNTFYIDTRYPVHWPAEVSKEEALKALEAARKIKEFVEKLLL